MIARRPPLDPALVDCVTTNTHGAGGRIPGAGKADNTKEAPTMSTISGTGLDLTVEGTQLAHLPLTDLLTFDGLRIGPDGVGVARIAGGPVVIETADLNAAIALQLAANNVVAHLRVDAQRQIDAERQAAGE